MYRSVLLSIFFFVGLGIVLFHIKYQVLFLEQRYTKISCKIKNTRESLHMLEAEWTHLNDPRRLQRLVNTYLVREKSNLPMEKRAAVKESSPPVPQKKPSPLSPVRSLDALLGKRTP
jgi:hypothetical protein